MGSPTKLINDLLDNIDGGAEVAAAYLGLSISSFNDRRYKNKGTRFFSGDELLALQQLSKTSLVAEYYAEQAGCMVIHKTRTDNVENFDLFALGLKAVQSRGELGRVLFEVINNGEAISDDKVDQIRKLADCSVKDILNVTENTIALHKKATNGN